MCWHGLSKRGPTLHWPWCTFGCQAPTHVPPLPPRALPAPGKTVASAGLHQMPGAFLASLDRDGAPLSGVTKDEVLREGDILWFAG